MSQTFFFFKSFSRPFQNFSRLFFMNFQDFSRLSKLFRDLFKSLIFKAFKFFQKCLIINTFKDFLPPSNNFCQNMLKHVEFFPKNMSNLVEIILSIFVNSCQHLSILGKSCEVAWFLKLPC